MYLFLQGDLSQQFGKEKTEPTGSSASRGSENAAIAKSRKQNVGSFLNVTQLISLHILALIGSAVVLFAEKLHPFISTIF
jgi:hypothetical protein